MLVLHGKEFGVNQLGHLVTDRRWMACTRLILSPAPIYSIADGGQRGHQRSLAWWSVTLVPRCVARGVAGMVTTWRSVRGRWMEEQVDGWFEGWKGRRDGLGLVDELILYK